MDDVEQMEKIVPLITRENSLCQFLCELVCGVDILDFESLDSDSFCQNSKYVGSGYVSHCWTPAFDDHSNHCFVVLKEVEHRTKFRRLRVRRNTINITKFQSVVLDWKPWSGLWVCLFDGVSRNRFPCTLPLDFFTWLREEWNTSITKIPKIESWNPILP